MLTDYEVSTHFFIYVPKD